VPFQSSDSECQGPLPRRRCDHATRRSGKIKRMVSRRV
jgi:hypothetical protein